MAIPTAQQLVANWQRGMAAAGPKYTAGINAVQSNPAEAASTPEALAKYQAATSAAGAPGGRMQQGLSKVTLQSWKAAASGVGATNLVTGAQKGAPKLAAVAPQLIAAQQAAKTAAAGVTGTSAKVMASINAMRAAFGKTPLA